MSAKKNCEGQITIMEYIQSLGAIPVASNLYMPGQVVFVVDLCDISKYEVFGIFNVDGEECVLMIAREGAESPFRCIPVSEEGVSIFETEKAAKTQVLKRLEECDCILASNMQVLGYKAFTAKDEDGTLLTAFYAQLANGYVYFKDYYSCGHLIKATPAVAEKMLTRSLEDYDCFDPVPANSVPHLKNMYRIKPRFEFDWEYAERDALICS